MSQHPMPLAARAPKRAGRPGGPALWLVHALGDSSLAFDELLSSSLCSTFELLAPDWPGAGAASQEPPISDLDGLADWLTQTIDRHTPVDAVGLVGHSLGAAVAVRAVTRLRRVVGVFSVEGNLTAADAYLSGLATAFEAAEDYRGHLLARLRAMAEGVVSSQRVALWRYRENVALVSPETLWKIGRSAATASRRDALGDEYRALSVPTLYYWSRENTPPQTREYIARRTIRNREFTGGHWPMVERPEETASEIARFFRPLFQP